MQSCEVVMMLPLSFSRLVQMSISNLKAVRRHWHALLISYTEKHVWMSELDGAACQKVDVCLAYSLK